MSDQQLQRQILDYWFGHVEESIAPTPERARLWFAEDPEMDRELAGRFRPVLQKAMVGELDHWLVDARGQLALIIVLDQFSRHVYRDTANAYAQDAKALMIAMQGAQREVEHHLSLIERVFYYFPLLHAEDRFVQQQSIQAYTLLEQYALEETKVIYQSFLQFAYYHHDVIQRFGRFPLRNAVLGRVSTEDEQAYINKHVAKTQN